MLREALELSVKNAIEFIGATQSPQGEFLTLASSDREFHICKKVFTVYIPTYIIHSLGCAKSHPATASIVENALQSLWRHREEGGVWRFFGRTKEYPPPDFDDTCCALAVLKQNRWEANTSLFSLLTKFQDRSGLFHTWIDEVANKRCFYRIDGVVNANILFYSALQSIQLPSIVRYLQSYIEMEKYGHLTLYAVSVYPSIYVITRAFRDGRVAGLQPSMPALIKYLLARQKVDGSWGNELDTTLAVVSLLNAGYDGESLLNSIDFLLQTQRDDGSWPSVAFCQDFRPTYYGSAQLTTALCLEAFHKFIALYASEKL